MESKNFSVIVFAVSMFFQVGVMKASEVPRNSVHESDPVPALGLISDFKQFGVAQAQLISERDRLFAGVNTMRLCRKTANICYKSGLVGFGLCVGGLLLNITPPFSVANMMSLFDRPGNSASRLVKTELAWLGVGGLCCGVIAGLSKFYLSKHTEKMVSDALADAQRDKSLLKMVTEYKESRSIVAPQYTGEARQVELFSTLMERDKDLRRDQNLQKLLA